MTLRRLTAILMTAGGLAAATQAHAQSAAEARRERAPIRASATVEVIDSARGIDDIISRVRDQRDRRTAANKERTRIVPYDRVRDSTDNSTSAASSASSATDGDRAKAGMDDRKDTTDNSMNRGGDDEDKRRGASNSGDREQLRPDKNDRPNPRADRDRREARRQDSDTRQTQPRDRARWNRR